MCGIVVAAGQLAYKQEKSFQTLLILDAIRGIDSTGIASIGRQALPPVVIKQPGNPYDLLETTGAEKIFRRANNVLIGHNRFATQGNVNKKNAHPFEFDNLVGVHNGTLTNKYQLPNGIDYAVDSQALYACMSEKGVRATLDIIQGAWSLVWFDYDKKTLNFLRNQERPMFMAYDKKSNALYAASEKWMLHIATSRHDVEIDDPFPTAVDMHYEFKVDPDGRIHDPICTEMKAKEPVRYHAPAWTAPVQQRNNVVALPDASKNGGVAPSSPVSSIGDLTYPGTKNVVLRCVSQGVDEHGAKYIMCYDSTHPGYHVRFFLSRSDKPESFLQKEITATIGKYHKPSGNGRIGYYKVDYGSVRMHRPEQAALVDEEEDTGERFMDVRGKLLTKEEWKGEHGQCAYCGSEIDPEHNSHRFSQSGDVLCGGCVHDPEVAQYVSIR